MITNMKVAGVTVLAGGSYSFQKLILFMIRQNPYISSYELKKRMATLCSPRTVRRCIQRLAEGGKIEKLGERNPHLKATY